MSTPPLTPYVRRTYLVKLNGERHYRGSLDTFFRRLNYRGNCVGDYIEVGGVLYAGAEAACRALLDPKAGWELKLSLAVFKATRPEHAPVKGTIPEIFEALGRSLGKAHPTIVTGDGEYPHAVYVGGKEVGQYASLKDIFDAYLAPKGWVLGSARARYFQEVCRNREGDLKRGYSMEDQAGSYRDRPPKPTGPAIEYRWAP